MFLDEAFDGLDGVTKEHCLEILKTYAADRLVIVISHVPEFQEVFDGKITLTLKDGVTTLSGE
jgi:DNA repair exonuclease SbcCD ATPase subunit